MPSISSAVTTTISKGHIYPTINEKDLCNILADRNVLIEITQNMRTSQEKLKSI